MSLRSLLYSFLLVSSFHISCGQFQGFKSSADASLHFTKIERMIPMRDGVKLFTAIYVPKEIQEALPFLLLRTPYSCKPYGESSYKETLGPGTHFENEPYIYVYQDVRGRYMSEGNFEEMTPHIENKKNNETDESSDTFDTIEWLLKNIENNNGKVGIYGISYPGFYATASLPNAHPALKAASPQAPVTDEFEGDDAYHRGAFFLMDNYNFLNRFDYPRTTTWKNNPSLCEQNISNAYNYYLQMGPIKNANNYCFANKSKIWNEYLQHDTKDAYWQARDIRIHLVNVKPAVLVVGGWYDAEDLFGSLQTYRAIENQNKKNNCQLIMGPWSHGSWGSGNWSRFGSMQFNTNTSQFFQKKELEFFDFYLKGKGDLSTSEATVFETGKNEWKSFDQWPPKNVVATNWLFQTDKQLSLSGKSNYNGYDEYVSDPASPVPYMQTNSGYRDDEYMIADQRFTSARKDVLSYTSAALANNVTIAGGITADLFISTTSTDADFVAKVIDVLPENTFDEKGNNISGMQRLVRAEIIRGKFRNSFEKPEPFVPGKITKVSFELNDVMHSFLKGHRIMVQVQSSWFPLVDRNPQQFMQIPLADEKDFKKATIKIHHSKEHPSGIRVGILTE